MNSLSWFLYLADVIPMFGFIVGEAAIIVLIIGGFIIALWFYASFGEEDAPKPPVKRYIALVTVLGVIGMLTPSKETIYLIAGSEAGEYVVTSPEGQEIINDIKTIIKGQISSYADG